VTVSLLVPISLTHLINFTYLSLCDCQGDDGGKQEAGGWATDVADAAADADESTAGTAHGAH